MSRIELNDTIKDMLIKLSEGNPGGLTVMLGLVEKTPLIDPDAAFGPIAHILSLDTFEIYGSRIWMLYKDVCGKKFVPMIAMLRAVQLGKLSLRKLNHAIDNRGFGVDVEVILKLVQAELPNFGKVEIFGKFSGTVIVSEHKRGDSSLGVIKKDYKVSDGLGGTTCKETQTKQVIPVSAKMNVFIGLLKKSFQFIWKPFKNSFKT